MTVATHRAASSGSTASAAAWQEHRDALGGVVPWPPHLTTPSASASTSSPSTEYFMFPGERAGMAGQIQPPPANPALAHSQPSAGSEYATGPLARTAADASIPFSLAGQSQSTYSQMHPPASLAQMRAGMAGCGVSDFARTPAPPGKASPKNPAPWCFWQEHNRRLRPAGRDSGCCGGSSRLEQSEFEQQKQQ